MSELDNIPKPRVNCDWCLTRHPADEHLSKQRRWDKRHVERVRDANRERSRRFRAARVA